MTFAIQKCSHSAMAMSSAATPPMTTKDCPTVHSSGATYGTSAKRVVPAKHRMMAKYTP